jgi:hypothetical protein
MLAVLVLALLQSPASAPAAEAAAAPTADTRTVTLTVVDEKGRPLQGLTTSDVAVLEGGQTLLPVKLEEDRRPLTLALILDSSQPLATTYRLHILDAAVAFLGRLPEGSRFSVWTTGDRPTKVVDFTTDRAAAAKSMRRVFPIGGNTLLDAIVEASRDLRTAEGARSALVVVTGSGPGFTNFERRQVVDEVKGRGIVVHAVTITDRSGEESGGGEVGPADYDYVAAELTRTTGGAREVVLSPMGLDQALQKVSGTILGEYRLTYAGTGSRDKKLEVTVARPGAKARVAQPRS